MQDLSPDELALVDQHEACARECESNDDQAGAERLRRVIERIKRHAAGIRTAAASISPTPDSRPNVCGDLNALHPAWRQEVTGRLALQRRGAIHRTRQVSIPRARQACDGGNRRPAHRSVAKTRGSPDSSESDSDGPGERPRQPLLAGRDRLLAASLARMGVYDDLLDASHAGYQAPPRWRAVDYHRLRRR